MKPKETYFYELIIIDNSEKTDITSIKSLLMALSYSDRLWKKPQLKNSSISDNALGILLSASIDNSSKMNETAFKLVIESSNQEKLDAFINSLVQHVKKKLLFSSVQISKDGVAATVTKQVEPLVEEVEKILSEYQVKHKIIKDVEWLVESSNDLNEAKKMTAELRKMLFAITNKGQTAKNKPPKVVKKTSAAKKVSKTASKPVLSDKIENVQTESVQKIVQEEQKPIVRNVESVVPADKVNSEQKLEAKTVASNEAFKMITEKELLDELKVAESSNNSFIDLKEFVNDVLVPKGYASGPTFSLARMMNGKGLVEIYDTKDAAGMPVKAVKIQ